MVTKKTMYTMLILGLLLGFFGGFLSARNRYKTDLIKLSVDLSQREAELKKFLDKEILMSEEYLMKDGRIVIVKDEKEAELTEDKTLPSGVKITTFGVVAKPDGTSIQLQNGESVWADGSIKNQEGVLQ